MSHTRWGPREEEAGKERRQHSWPSVALPLPRCDVFPGLGSEAQLLPLCSFNLCLLAEQSPKDQRSELPDEAGQEKRKRETEGIAQL